MTERPPHGWTPETLFQLRQADQQAMSELRRADQNALEAALAAMNYRLEGMNEFRKTVEDITATMLPRKEAWGILVGAVGMVTAILALILHK